MSDLSKVFLFRMTHRKNIPHILSYGFTHETSSNKNSEFVSIGDGSLISARHSFQMPNGKKLGDYIPFYFGYRMPMLYVIQHGFNGVAVTNPKDIVYCISSVAMIKESNLDYVFTDGHALDGFTGFYFSYDLANINNIIDKKAINSKYWIDEKDLDLKRRKEAEFLILGDIPRSAILGFAVYDSNIAEEISKTEGIDTAKIIVKPEYYF